MRSVLGLVFGLAACNSILGIRDVHVNEGVDAPTTSADEPPTTSDVHGTAMWTLYDGPGSTETTPRDLSMETFAAYVPDGHGGFHVIEGGPGTTSGTFTIPQVPEGGYYLAVRDPYVGVPAFYYTTSYALDL